MKTPVFQRGLLLGVALLVGMPLSAAAKCSFRGPDGGRMIPVPPPVIILDGRQSIKSDINALNLNLDDIEAVHILCWKSADSTFSMAHGGTGLNVIRIVTKGLVDRLVAALYRASEAGSPSSATQASAGGLPRQSRMAKDEVVVELSADGTQWSATLKLGAMVHRCVLDVSRPSMPASEIQRSCDFTIAQGEKHVFRGEG